MRPVPRSARSLILLVVCAVTFAGCTGGESDPTEYGDVNTEGDGYYGNFMFGCTGVEPTDGEYVDETMEPANFCTCLFEGLKETVPFAEMQEFEEAQEEAADDELEIPANIEEVRQDCVERELS